MSDEKREWLVRKGGYFYRPNGAGYTTRKIEAGRYTKAEAVLEAAVTELDKDALDAAFRAADEAAPTGRAYAPAIKAAICAYLDAADDWRPIETAPRERFINLYCPEDKSIWWAKWQGGEWYGIDDLGLTRRGHSAGDPNSVTGWAVAKWRPLPSPPKEGE